MSRSFSVATFGIKALDAHANGAKHKECLPVKGSIISFTKKESVQPKPQKATSSKIYTFGNINHNDKVGIFRVPGTLTNRNLLKEATKISKITSL